MCEFWCELRASLAGGSECLAIWYRTLSLLSCVPIASRGFRPGHQRLPCLLAVGAPREEVAELRVRELVDGRMRPDTEITPAGHGALKPQPFTAEATLSGA